MSTTTLFSVGIVCIIGAVVGGGLKAFGIELPALQSLTRQVILAGIGCGMLIASYVVQQSGKVDPVQPEVELLDTKNNDAVLNGPPKPTVFETTQPYLITDIWDYHWNGGQGTTPGNIKLQRSDGEIFGPWEVTAPDTNGKINWACKPNTRIPAGKYTLIDSEASSWSYDEASGGMGMTKVKGRPVK